MQFSISPFYVLHFNSRSNLLPPPLSSPPLPPFLLCAYRGRGLSCTQPVHMAPTTKHKFKSGQTVVGGVSLKTTGGGGAVYSLTGDHFANLLLSWLTYSWPQKQGQTDREDEALNIWNVLFLFCCVLSSPLQIHTMHISNSGWNYICITTTVNKLHK